MIAADTSSLIAFFDGSAGPDVDLIREALDDGSLRISPVVFTELLSDPRSTHALQDVLLEWRQLEITDGFWLRAALTRSELISRKLRPKVPDTLIAQSCIDHDVALITRDADFRHFAKHCGLKLA